MDTAFLQVCMRGKVDLAPNDVYDLLTHPQNHKIFRGIEVRPFKARAFETLSLSSGPASGPQILLDAPCHGMLGSSSLWSLHASTALPQVTLPWKVPFPPSRG